MTNLVTHTFLVGERLSLVDITAATVLRGAYSSILEKAERAKYPQIVNQPRIKDALASAELAETAQPFVPPQRTRS